MKEELRRLIGRKKPARKKAGLERKTTDSLGPTTNVFYELEHFPQETPEQPSLNTPYCPVVTPLLVKS